MSGMLKYSGSDQLTVTAYRTSLDVSFIGDKKMEKPSNFGNLPIFKKKKKKHNWRGPVEGMLSTKWPTVYLRGQIGQTLSNYPSMEGKDFLLFSLLFFPVCESTASFQLTNQRSLLT